MSGIYRAKKIQWEMAVSEMRNYFGVCMAMKHRDLILYELKRRLEQKRMSSFIKKMAEIKSAESANPAHREEVKKKNWSTPELYQVREGESNGYKN